MRRETTRYLNVPALGEKPNFVSCVDFRQWTKDRITMARDPYIPGVAGNCRVRDVPNG